jgi:hypothetical protein
MHNTRYLRRHQSHGIRICLVSCLCYKGVYIVGSYSFIIPITERTGLTRTTNILALFALILGLIWFGWLWCRSRPTTPTLRASSLRPLNNRPNPFPVLLFNCFVKVLSIYVPTHTSSPNAFWRHVIMQPSVCLPSSPLHFRHNPYLFSVLNAYSSSHTLRNRAKMVVFLVVIFVISPAQ